MHDLLKMGFWARGAGCLCLVVLSCSNDKPEPGGTHDGASQKSRAEPDSAVAEAQVKLLERQLQQATAAVEASDADLALRAIEAGLELATKLGDDLVKARLLLLRGDVEQGRGKDSEARRYYADATALFHVLANDEGRLATLISLAALEMRKGDNAAAGAHLEEADPLAANIRDRSLLARYKEQLGRLSARRLEHTQASAQLAEAYGLYKDLNEQRRGADILLLMAAADDAAGRDAASRKNLETAAKLYRELADPRGEAQALARLAASAERDGRYGQARALFTKVVDIYTQMGDPGAAAAVTRRMNALPEQGGN